MASLRDRPTGEGHRTPVSPEELRAWFEQLSPDERRQALTASGAALMAGRRWAQANWQTFRAHPCWSHFMQAWVARRHYWRMLRMREGFLTWCRRKDREERRIARIVAILHALRRACDRVGIDIAALLRGETTGQTMRDGAVAPEQEIRTRADEEAIKAQEEAAATQCELLDLITGANRRKEVERLTPAERAKLEAAKAAADRAAAERRAKLPPAERIATEVELTALTLEAGASRWNIPLTPAQCESVQSTAMAGDEAAAARLARLSTEQRVAVEALLALLLTTDADWERLYSAGADWKTYGEATVAAAAAIVDAAVRRPQLPLPAELREAVEDKLIDLLDHEMGSCEPPEPEVLAHAVLHVRSSAPSSSVTLSRN